jgi:putative hydrolase of the HAD superfamily
MFDIAAAGFAPKPKPDAYARFLDAFEVEPTRAAMFEDLPRNLAHPHAIGFTTVLVRTGKDWSSEPVEARPAAHGEDHDHVHHVTDDLGTFLGAVKLAAKPD